MSSMRLTDDAIRAALTLPAAVRAPAGLAEQVHAAVAATPQRRRSILGWAPSRPQRLVLRLLLVGLALLALGAILLFVGSQRPPPVPPTTSTYHGGPGRSGVMPGPGVTGVPRIEWHHQVKGPMGAWSPVVVDGTVFVADEGGYVTALDEPTGSQRWQQPVGAAINGGITVDSGLVIVGDDAGVVHALTVADGHEAWRATASAPVHSAAVVIDGVAWVGTTDGHLVALDVLTGRPYGDPILTRGPVSRALAAAGGLVYVGSAGATPRDGGTLQAYDAATATLRWAAPLEPGDTSTPSVADGLVFVTGGLDQTATGAHDLYAFDAATGAAVWPPFRAPTGTTLLIGAVAGGRVFALGDDRTMYVVDAPTGREIWRAAVGSTQSSSAGIAGGSIYVTSDDRAIHAFDIAGRAPLGGGWPIAVPGVPGSPVIIDGRILVGTSFGEVVSISGP